jgi:DNA-binding transcriptional MocR family regulator
MPDEVTWTRPQGGFFIWVTMPDLIDASVLVVRLAERGVHVLSGESFYFSDRGRHELRLSYSYPTVEEITTGIAILGEEIRAALG